MLQDQILGYDLQGRLDQIDVGSDVVNGAVTETILYDAVGNKLSEVTTQGDAAPQYLYFAYNEMNEQVLADGAVDNNAANMNNVTATQGHILTYDLDGNRASDTFWGTQVAIDGSSNPYINGDGKVNVDGSGFTARAGAITEFYSYDALNRLQFVSTNDLYTSGFGGFATIDDSNVSGGPGGVLLQERFYDAASQVVEEGEGYPNGGPDPSNGEVPFDGGLLYNDYIFKLLDGKSPSNQTMPGEDSDFFSYDAAGRVLQQSDFDLVAGINNSTTHYDAYDNDGNVTKYNINNAAGANSTVSFNYTVDAGFGVKESSVQNTGQGSNAGSSSTSTESYDADGNLISVSASTSSPERTLFYDDSGQILEKDQGSTDQTDLIVDGAITATYGSGVTSNFDLAYARVDDIAPGPTSGEYVVQPGDTLQSIALQAYGDASLSYLIAEANGISSNQDLVVDQTITIPTVIGDIHNNDTTIAPYNAAKIVGSTVPNLPPPQANGGGGCGIIGEIIELVVTVVVTVFTEGATANLLADELGVDLATTSLASVAVGAAAGAVGGAVGSIVGQAVGIAIGAQSGFDLGAVALGALGGALTGGIDGVPAPDAAGGFSLEGGIFGATPTIGEQIAGAALANAATQGLGVAFGLQKSFNFAEVAGAAVGAGVGAEAGQSLGEAGLAGAAGTVDGIANTVISGTVGGFAGGVTAAVLQGGKINLGQIATDAFGNALGNSLGGSLGQAANASLFSPDQAAADAVAAQQASAPTANQPISPAAQVFNASTQLSNDELDPNASAAQVFQDSIDLSNAETGPSGAAPGGAGSGRGNSSNANGSFGGNDLSGPGVDQSFTFTPPAPVSPIQIQPLAPLPGLSGDAGNDTPSFQDGPQPTAPAPVTLVPGGFGNSNSSLPVIRPLTLAPDVLEGPALLQFLASGPSAPPNQTPSPLVPSVPNGTDNVAPAPAPAPETPVEDESAGIDLQRITPETAVAPNAQGPGAGTGSGFSLSNLFTTAATVIAGPFAVPGLSVSAPLSPGAGAATAAVPGDTLSPSQSYFSRIGSDLYAGFSGAAPLSDVLSTAYGDTEDTISNAFFPFKSAASLYSANGGQFDATQFAEGVGGEALNTGLHLAQATEQQIVTALGGPIVGQLYNSVSQPIVDALSVDITPARAEGANLFDTGFVVASAVLPVESIAGRVSEVAPELLAAEREGGTGFGTGDPTAGPTEPAEPPVNPEAPPPPPVEPPEPPNTQEPVAQPETGGPPETTTTGGDEPNTGETLASPPRTPPEPLAPGEPLVEPPAPPPVDALNAEEPPLLPRADEASVVPEGEETPPLTPPETPRTAGSSSVGPSTPPLPPAGKLDLSSLQGPVTLIERPTLALIARNDGSVGEAVAQQVLEDATGISFRTLKNASDNGLDLIGVDTANRTILAPEVKSSTVGRFGNPGNLAVRTEDTIRDAAQGSIAGQRIPIVDQKYAQRVEDLLSQGYQLKPVLVQISLPPVGTAGPATTTIIP